MENLKLKEMIKCAYPLAHFSTTNDAYEVTVCSLDDVYEARAFEEMGYEITWEGHSLFVVENGGKYPSGEFIESMTKAEQKQFFSIIYQYNK